MGMLLTMSKVASMESQWWIDVMRSVNVPWIDIVAFILVIFLIVFVFLSMAKKPKVKKEIVCPLLQKPETIELGVNVFRDPAKKAGLDVQTCTEFLHGTGEVTCGKDCLHLPGVQKVHEEALEEHKKDLRNNSTAIP